MLQKLMTSLGIAFALTVTLATPAMANHVDTFTVTPSCDGSYTVAFTASQLNPGTRYTIDFTISGLGLTTINDFVPFTPSSTTYSSGPIPATTKLVFSGTVTLSGSATLLGQNTIPITFSPSATVSSCPFVCTIPASGTQISGSGTSWNKFTPQGAGNVVWINMHIGTPIGVSTTVVTTVQYTAVQFVLNGKTYALPDGFLIFDSAHSGSPTTTFYSASTYPPNGRWVTMVNPSNLSDEIFFDGQAVPVDSNISGGGQANIYFTTNSTDNNLKFSWQWSAAVYTYWPGNSAANILPYHQSLHAGTPLNTTVEHSLIQGPRGGGGSNYTGSWSGTGNGKCPGAN